MNRSRKLLAAVSVLERNGLSLRGMLHFTASESGPMLGDNCPAKSLILIGHAGSSIWPHFHKWRSTQPQHFTNPLDAWSEQVITPVANALRGRAIFPFQKPFHPFQQWAMRAEGLKPSPLGTLVHPVYGLWHAYRGAIAFEDEILIQEIEKENHPCDLCIGKPCLSACPVGAFSGQGYDVKGCRTHLSTEAGNECMRGGCKARLACPAGREYVYAPEQMQFHMRAFAGN
jgi:ferredoxin